MRHRLLGVDASCTSRPLPGSVRMVDACRTVAISHNAIVPATRTASATVLPVINPISSATSATTPSAVATARKTRADRDRPVACGSRIAHPAVPKTSTAAVVPRALEISQARSAEECQVHGDDRADEECRRRVLPCQPDRRHLVSTSTSDESAAINVARQMAARASARGLLLQGRWASVTVRPSRGDVSTERGEAQVQRGPVPCTPTPVHPVARRTGVRCTVVTQST